MIANEIPLIGLSGYARSGKDTVCEMLRDYFAAQIHLDIQIERVAFADALKAEVCQHYDISRAELERNKAKWRTILQEWGQGNRNTDADYWVKRAQDEVESRLTCGEISPRSYVCVTDVRYPNELEWIDKEGGVNVRIIRDETGPVNAHQSESALDGASFDYYLFNDGDEDDLRAHVVRLGLFLKGRFAQIGDA